MVNWQAPDADLRLFAAVMAATPGINPSLTATAVLYGRGASDRAIHHQLTRVRKLAKELADEARKRGAQIPQATPRSAARAPRTPRTQSAGKSKTSSTVNSQVKRKLFDTTTSTPSKTGKTSSTQQQGHSVVDPISVDSDDTDSDSDSVNNTQQEEEEEEQKEDTKSVKSETTIAPGEERKKVKKEESGESSRNFGSMLKKDASFIVPPFGSPGDDDVFGIGRVQPRVSSQTNGYVDIPEVPAMQNFGGGYHYDIFDDTA